MERVYNLSFYLFALPYNIKKIITKYQIYFFMNTKTTECSSKHSVISVVPITSNYELR